MLISAVLFKGKTFAIASIGLDCGIANATAAGRMDLKGINSKARQTKNGASAFRHLKFDIKHITASDHKTFLIPPQRLHLSTISGAAGGRGAAMPIAGWARSQIWCSFNQGQVFFY